MGEQTGARPLAEDASARASINDDPALEAAGWVRRHLADPVRARESAELYESLGFEVMSRRLRPEDLGPECQACAISVCHSYVLIYTRSKQDRPSGGDPCNGAQ
jgi:hypothetical protein